MPGGGLQDDGTKLWKEIGKCFWQKLVGLGKTKVADKLKEVTKNNEIQEKLLEKGVDELFAAGEKGLGMVVPQKQIEVQNLGKISCKNEQAFVTVSRTVTLKVPGLGTIPYKSDPYTTKPCGIKQGQLMTLCACTCKSKEKK